MPPDNAVFCATYSDVRLVKTRGVVQLVFEIPVEKWNAEGARVMGDMPVSGEEAWFAIARLSNNEKKPPAKDPTKRLVQQAGIMCADGLFQRFLFERGHIPEMDEEMATSAVRGICQVQSRTEIVTGTPAAAHWEKLAAEFEMWKRE